jgi:hypothetical protein
VTQRRLQSDWRSRCGADRMVIEHAYHITRYFFSYDCGTWAVTLRNAVADYKKFRLLSLHGVTAQKTAI